MSVDYQNMVEDWGEPTTKPILDPESVGRGGWIGLADAHDNRFQTNMHAAGFETQDKLTSAMSDTDLGREQKIASALYKATYPLTAGDANDLEYLKEGSGNKLVPALVGATVVNDLYQGVTGKKPIKNWPDNIEFSTFGQGAPGLKATWRW
jgi:hypothetical protein